MKSQNMLPINAFYVTWLRDKGYRNRPEAKRYKRKVDKESGEIQEKLVSRKTAMDSTDLLIYLMLLSRADKDKLTCYPSIETICSDCMGMDRETIWLHLKDLEQMQFIEIRKKKGKSNTYFMLDFAKWREKPCY